jgi:K+-transporting ATPase ATPase C chain
MNQFKTAIKIFLFMTVLTGVIYPLFITLVAQFTMSNLSNGSLVKKGDQIVGSLLIAQNTTDDRYFWPRPSAIDYDPIKPSGGSNLGPTSQKLKDTVEERKKKVGNEAPSELLYASGSGLDPHISLETAYFQIPRVAKARSIQESELKKTIDSIAEGKQLGFLGSRYINVLLLNQALDDRKR